MSSGSVIARSTFSFSVRISVASNAVGSSIATSASNCIRWFCSTSRAVPTLS